jgi:DNA-nicking Smr family endonuclease
MIKSVDLHGVKHQDVSRVLDEFLWGQMQTKATEVRIVTGNSQTMKNLVKETLLDYDFTSEEEFGNNGILIVKIK